MNTNTTQEQTKLYCFTWLVLLFFWLFIKHFRVLDLNPSNTVMPNATVLCPKHGINGSLIIPEPAGDSPYWGLHSTVPIYVALIVFPLLNFRNVSFFTRFNSLGKFTDRENDRLSMFWITIDLIACLQIVVSSPAFWTHRLLSVIWTAFYL